MWRSVGSVAAFAVVGYAAIQVGLEFEEIPEAGYAWVEKCVKADPGLMARPTATALQDDWISRSELTKLEKIWRREQVNSIKCRVRSTAMK